MMGQIGRWISSRRGWLCEMLDDRCWFVFEYWFDSCEPIEDEL